MILPLYIYIFACNADNFADHIQNLRGGEDNQIIIKLVQNPWKYVFVKGWAASFWHKSIIVHHQILAQQDLKTAW